MLIRWLAPKLRAVALGIGEMIYALWRRIELVNRQDLRPFGENLVDRQLAVNSVLVLLATAF